jgi:HK97 family phage prohead protease
MSTRELIERAAHQRGAQVAQRVDRPSQRRSADGVRGWTPAPAKLELRAASDAGKLLTFEGHATVYEARYEMWDLFGPYDEVVTAGAGTNSLHRPELDVPLVLDHDSLRRIARTTNGSLQLEETDHGLHVLAEQLDPDDADVAYITPKLRSGLIDEMSFRFRIVRGEWSDDWSEYRIIEYDIHRGDVAIVGYGANPHTDGALRGQVPAARPERAAGHLRNLLDLALATR